MKRIKNLYENVYQFDTLHRAYLRARRVKRHVPEVLHFERDLEGELIQLQNELIWRTYRTGPYHTFYVHEPKRRLVAALAFRDRVVQHALVEQLEPIYEARFIDHSYACRNGKGAHAGADQLQHWMRVMQRNHGRMYALKADIRQYFASIDHDALKRILARKIGCPPTLELCFEIIDSWCPGLPIGNLTSQLWANVYLHELDLFAKHELRARHYLRYMDDFCILHPDKAVLNRMLAKTSDFLEAELCLDLNQKTQIFPIGPRAVDFLGYRIWPTHRKLRKRSIVRVRRRMKKLKQLYASGLVDLSKVKRHISSWLGHAQHADSYRTRRGILGAAVFKRTQETRQCPTSR